MQIKANGNVAIGTTTANGLVHMASSDLNSELRIANTFGTGGRSRISMGTDECEWRMVNDGNLDVFKLRDETGGVDRIVIDEAGEVGIGETNPTAKLHVDSSGSIPSFHAAGSTADFSVPDGEHMQFGKWDGAGTFTENMRIAIDGRVGVGHTTPDAVMHVQSTGNVPNFLADGGSADYAVPDGHTMQFGHWDRTSVFTERMKITTGGNVVVNVLEITGGADFAEPFNIPKTEQVTPGMVVSIDPSRPGNLRVATHAYDRTVAGVVSGAGGVNPGLIMSQTASDAESGHPVALTGRVYVLADASSGPIVPGDLLTTSDVVGHAMKVTDYGRAHGAVIGKAMSSLESGRGLVLALVALQ